MFFKEFTLPSSPVFPEREVNIRDFGAVEGVLSTEAVNRAISETSERGGGRVIVPKGDWLFGAIHLKSNIDLHFEEGAIARFSDDPEDFLPCVFTVYEGIRCYNYSPLIYGRCLENVASRVREYLTDAALCGGDGRRIFREEIFYITAACRLKSVFSEHPSLLCARCSYRYSNLKTFLLRG